MLTNKVFIVKHTSIWRLRACASSFRETFCDFNRSALSWSTPNSRPLSVKIIIIEVKLAFLWQMYDKNDWIIFNWQVLHACDLCFFVWNSIFLLHLRCNLMVDFTEIKLWLETRGTDYNMANTNCLAMKTILSQSTIFHGSYNNLFKTKLNGNSKLMMMYFITGQRCYILQENNTSYLS